MKIILLLTIVATLSACTATGPDYTATSFSTVNVDKVFAGRHVSPHTF